MNPYTFQSSQYLFNALGNQFTVINYFNQINSQNFRNLVHTDLSVINTPRQGDTFFEEHAVFIQSYHLNNQGHLGYEAWLNLLGVVFDADPVQYKEIHKGTAYYHASIFALKSNRFLEGLELMDYGFTSDLKTNPNAISAPGGLYIGLRYPQRGNDWGEGQKLDQYIREVLREIPVFGNRHFNVIFLRSRAKKYFLTRRSGSRRSAWVSLLASFLSKKEIQRFIEVTPDYGESQTIPKFDLTSLCLILETLLTYSPEGKRSEAIMINNLYQALIDTKLPQVRAHRQTVYNGLRNLSYSRWIRQMDRYISMYGLEVVAFSVAWILRNKVNHIFLDTRVELNLYNKLFDLLAYAILISLKLLY